MVVSFDDSLVIRLLDHQVVARDGHHLGKVDDLSLRQDGEDLVVEALMIGPAALAPRYPGAMGRWPWAIWRRLNDPDDPGVVLVPLERVVDIGSHVEVDDEARATLLASFGLERWLRRHLISRIPGAKGGGHRADERHPGGPTVGRREGEGLEVAERGSSGPLHRLTELVDMQVRDACDEAIGRVTDVRGVAHDVARGIPVTAVLVGPRLMGSSLGYSSDEQDGPWAISWVVGRLHRTAHWRDRREIASISWTGRRIDLSTHR